MKSLLNLWRVRRPPQGSETWAGTLPSSAVVGSGDGDGTGEAERMLWKRGSWVLNLKTCNKSSSAQHLKKAEFTREVFGEHEKHRQQCYKQRVSPERVPYLQAGVPDGQHAAVGGPLDPCQVLSVRVKVLPRRVRGTEDIENVFFNKYTNIYLIPDALTQYLISLSRHGQKHL